MTANTGSRVRVDDVGYEVTITVGRGPLGPRSCVGAFLLVWLTGWTFGGFMALAQFVRGAEALLHHTRGGPGPEAGAVAFLGFWLIGWLVGEVAVICTLLGLFAGSQTLTIGNGKLVARRRPIGRRRELNTCDVTDLRVVSTGASSSWDQSASARLVVEAQGKEQRLLDGLLPADAEAVREVLVERFFRHLRDRRPTG